MTVESPLAGLAEYPADWSHSEKRIYPGENLSLPGAYFKWYDIRSAHEDPTPRVAQEARDFLRAEVAAGNLELRNELGFVLLHRVGDQYYMIVCVWRKKNEMCEAIYWKDQAAPFQPYPVPGDGLRPVQEVVELDATAHERRAWSRYLRSARDITAKQAYVQDVCTGSLI